MLYLLMPTTSNSAFNFYFEVSCLHIYLCLFYSCHHTNVVALKYLFNMFQEPFNELLASFRLKSAEIISFPSPPPKKKYASLNNLSKVLWEMSTITIHYTVYTIVDSLHVWSSFCLHSLYVLPNMHCSPILHLVC